MKVVVLLFFALLLATAVVSLLVLYLRYAGSPAAQWKRRVRAAVGEQRARLRAARRELADAEAATDPRRLREEYLDRHLRGIAVEALVRYPGIGPVTASRLRDAGLTNLAALSRGHLGGVPGIGPVREKDLRAAIRQERREAESRFEAGACPEAVAYAAERKRREAEAAGQRRAAEQRVRDADATLHSLAERDRVAAGITFLGHLFGHEPPGLTDELMARPLFDPPAPPPRPPRQIPVAKLEPPPAPKPAAPGPPPPPTPAPELRSGPLPDWMTAEPPVTPARPVVVPAPPPPPVERVPIPAAPEPAIAPARPVAVAEPAPAPILQAETPPPQSPAPPPPPSPEARLRTVVGLGLAVAKADGRIAAAERKQVRAFAERRYTPPDLTSRLDAVLAEVEADLPTLGDALWDVKRAIPADAWPDMYQLAVSVADAAGERNTREVECLARVAEELNVSVEPPPAHVPAPVVATEPDSPLTEPDCRAALEIAPDTPLSVDLVRRQYRLLSDRFAPERFASHGPEFIQMAADKRERITSAARHLLAAYNEPLEAPAAPPPADLRHNPDLDDVFGA